MAAFALSFSSPISGRRSFTIFGRLAVVLPLLGGCVTTHNDVTGSIAPSPKPTSEAGLRDESASWGDKYRANPSDKTAALNYAQALRGLTQHNQAVAVLETAVIKTPYDRDLLAAYGKALADVGRLREAADVLSRAHTPDNPNWSVLSAQGSVADQLGDHAQAQSFYSTALKIKPGDPGILSNLGLSYALSNRLADAEQTERQAAASLGADMRVRQNLALVLGLEGKFGEAEQIAQQDLPPADAAANIAAIRSMIAQSNTWRKIQQTGNRTRPAAKTATAVTNTGT